MDIKGIVRNVIPFGVSGAKDVKTRSKLDADNEKEGNGQQAGGEDKRRRQLSKEEIEEAIKYLESLPGFKDNNLRLRLETKDGINVVYIEDPTGKVVRRIPESELSMLTANREKKSGHLLNKAM